MKPTISIIGTTHQVSFAPPVSSTSTTFIATSIDIIEISDMPMAVLNAVRSAIWRDKMIVSSIIEVISPLAIAKTIIASVDQGMPVYWKNAIVPKSPIAHPSKHQAVLWLAVCQVWTQSQLIDKCSVIVVIGNTLLCKFGIKNVSSNWKVKCLT